MWRNFRNGKGMIDFKTKVELPKKGLKLGYSDNMMLLGSCFSENISQYLIKSKFCCDVNPFGILYNPLSIAIALREILANRVYHDADWELFCHEEMWHSYMHHSRFSADSRAACIDLINDRLRTASENLRSLDCLLLTFGTARCYYLKENNKLVANCHKLPDRLFYRELLSVDDIVGNYVELITELLRVRPTLKIVFTVSPVRHAKDGFHGNQLSKAILLLAVERLCELFPNCYYFPSYEILLDELRDYRFYADDMLHPSPLAKDYIWECFCEAYFTAETISVKAECEEIARALEHRPFRPDSIQYKKFLNQIVLKIGRLIEKCPTLDFKNELELCRIRLKQ